MLIRSMMTTSVITISADMTCADAWDIFTAKKLRRAPVLEGSHVLGMLSDGDLKRVQPWTIEERDQRNLAALPTSVRQVLGPNLISVAPNDHLEKAAQLMLQAKVGALPVIDGRYLKGIVSRSDILKLFVRRTMTQRGHRLVLNAPKESVRDLNPAAICVKAQMKIYDLGMYPLDKGRTSVVLRVHGPDVQVLVDQLLANGYELVLMEES